MCGDSSRETSSIRTRLVGRDSRSLWNRPAAALQQVVDSCSHLSNWPDFAKPPESVPPNYFKGINRSPESRCRRPPKKGLAVENAAPPDDRRAVRAFTRRKSCASRFQRQRPTHATAQCVGLIETKMVRWRQPHNCITDTPWSMVSSSACLVKYDFILACYISVTNRAIGLLQEFC